MSTCHVSEKFAGSSKYLVKTALYTVILLQCSLDGATVDIRTFPPKDLKPNDCWEKTEHSLNFSQGHQHVGWTIRHEKITVLNARELQHLYHGQIFGWNMNHLLVGYNCTSRSLLVHDDPNRCHKKHIWSPNNISRRKIILSGVSWASLYFGWQVSALSTVQRTM